MPNRTIYIRRDDVEIWDNLKNKSQVISDVLNGVYTISKFIKAWEPDKSPNKQKIPPGKACRHYWCC